MNKNSLLDNQIKAALIYEEDKILMSYDPLKKAKQKLKNESMMDRRISMISLFHKRTMKISLAFVVILILIGGAIGVSATSLFKTDKINYPFVDDQRVIGKWMTVDFVKTANEFVPDKKSWSGDLFLKEFAFIKNGKMLISVNQGNGALAYSSTTWTKGMVINTDEKTASKYEIMNIDGSTYMFYEWKSGDYVFRGMQPYIYVLKKVDNNDYSNYNPSRKVDKIDYPFVDDPQVIGKWSSVDFVEAIDKFNPEKKSWISGLYLTALNFGKDGKLITSTEKGDYSGCITWTKGLVLNQNELTASAYIIKEINRSTYLFFEWKSGDYTFRGMQPYYYVLKKEQ